MDVKERIESLKKIINHHRYLYHVLDKQEISDSALDSLKHELYLLEQKHPQLITSDSPTQRVEGIPLSIFKKYEHLIPMLSIEDIFSVEELNAWQEYLKRITPSADFEYFSELKIDGFAISLIYEKGIFVKGSTRGNGKIGEDVTQNLKTIESIPLKLSLHKNVDPAIEKHLKEIIKNGVIEIRGEVYMEKNAFEKFNKELEKKGEKTYANPRNLSAGSIRQLNSKVAASRPLKFLAYDIVTDIGQKTHFQEHQVLPGLGFITDPGKKCRNLDEIVNYWRETARKREMLAFQIDGIVINVNDNSLFEKLGKAGKGFRGIRAFKFSPKQATTRILDIKVQIGRTGAITPVAYLKPVEVGGTMVSRATLHNEDEIKRLGVKIGDTVIIERAGDVIPAVAKTMKELRSGEEKEFHFPKECPVCKTKLIKPKEEAVWRCPNKNCSAVKREFFYHFTSKKAFDINGLGPKIIDKLMDENLISSASDIFLLKEGDLVPLERFAEKSAKNLQKAIEKAKEIPLPRFILSLGIRHVGQETALDLASCFNSIERIEKSSKMELEEINDIGPKVSESISEWFSQKENKEFVENLLKAGVKIIPVKETRKELSGKTFILTGTLESMSREQAKDIVRSLGGKTSESVSKNIDYLVAGENPGSKTEKARRINVKIISEKEFKNILKGRNK